MTHRLLVLALLTAGPLAAPGAAAQPDPAASFAEASADMRRIVGDLAVLQEKYRLPDPDRKKIEADFRAAVARGRQAHARLEEAALALIVVQPDNAEAIDICGAVAFSALEGDDPLRALAVVGRLTDAGVVNPDLSLLGASAALLLARPSEALDWLERAAAAGAPAERVATVRGSIGEEAAKLETELARRAAAAEADDLPRVKLETTAGDLIVELFEDDAPNTVANFISLVEKGFYDGTPFHRVIGGFMAQGGDPTGTGSGGPGYTIACEWGRPEARRHFLGTLSMAHAGRDTGGSQFFLTFRPTEHLDGKHTVFGRVVEGLEVLPKLVRTQDAQGQPVAGAEVSKILSARVLRKRDHAYEPVTRPDAAGR